MIATPGRILDLMKQSIAKMDKCSVLVLDEVRLAYILLEINMLNSCEGELSLSFYDQ